jgi:FixJ family two-component response regulator
MNGQELASRLCSQKPNLTILYMSGYTSDTIAEFFPETFQTGFLQQPFPSSELVAQVRRQIASAVGG